MFRIFLLAAGVLMCIASCAQPTSYNLSGRVEDVITGDPLEGVLVETHESGLSAVTDSTGSFSLGPLGGGRYHIHLYLTGYQAMATFVEVPAGGTVVMRMQPTRIEMRQVLVESTLSGTDYLHHSTDVISIGDAELDRNRGVTLAESLKLIPGVQSINTGVSMAKPVIRGLSGNRILVSDLGLKQEGQQWGNDHGLEIDQFAAGRMEVIKGPGSLLYGSDALGGVIHILPPSVPEQGLRGEWQMLGRTNNSFVGSSLMLEGNRKGRFFRGRVTWNQYGDYRVPAEEFTYLRRTLPIENGRLKNTAGKELHSQFTVGIAGAHGSVKWTTSNYHQQAGLFPGIVGIPTGFSVSDDGDRWNVDLPRFYINHFKSAVNAAWNRPRGWLQLDAGVQENVRAEQINPSREGYAPLPPDDEAYRLELRNAQLSVRWHGEKSELFRWIPGVSVQLSRHRRSGYEYLLPDFSSWQAGAFIFGEYQKPHANSVWSGGLRADHGSFHSERFTTLTYGPGEVVTGILERTAGVDRQFTNVSGAIGVSWLFREGRNLKLNAGKSFRVPASAEWTINGVHHGTFRHEQGDASLRSEHGYQLDLVWLMEGADYLFKLTPWVSYFDGFIYLRPGGFFSELPDGGQVYIYTQHDAVFTGAEVYAEHHPVEPLHLDVGMAYVHSYNVQTGLALPFTPPFQATLHANWEWEGRKTKAERSLGIAVRGSARQWWVDRNELPTNGYVLADLNMAADVRIARQLLELRVSVTNVLDAKYMEHLSLYRRLFLPEQGRNLVVSVKIPFAFMNQE